MTRGHVKNSLTAAASALVGAALAFYLGSWLGLLLYTSGFAAGCAGTLTNVRRRDDVGTFARALQDQLEDDHHAGLDDALDALRVAGGRQERPA
jgi:hypothetical protein